MVNTGVVIECMWRLYVYFYIHKGRNLLSVVVDLTCPEIGKSMISRVNNDVNPNVTLLTLLIIDFPISGQVKSTTAERRFLPLCIYRHCI